MTIADAGGERNAAAVIAPVWRLRDNRSVKETGGGEGLEALPGSMPVHAYSAARVGSSSCPVRVAAAKALVSSKNFFRARSSVIV